MRSIRGTLLRNLVLLFALAWLAVTMATYLVARHETRELFDAQLAQACGIIAEISLPSLLSSHAENISLSRDVYGHRYERKVSFQIWRGDQLLLRSRSAPGERMSARQGFSDEALAGESWRVFSRVSDDRAHTIYVGERYDVRNELIANIAASTLYPAALLLPLVALLIWLSIGAGLSPLARIAREVKKRTSRQLDPLPRLDTPKEVEPLTDAINDLLLRLRRAFERETRFTADAAHELRTPLASIRTQAQVALRARNPEQRVHALERVVEGTYRSGRLIEQLITLARLEPELFDERLEPVDPFAVVEEVIAALRSRDPGPGVHITLNDYRTDPPGEQLRGSAPALEILFRNLLDNALRHSPKDGCVQVRVSASDTEICVQVIDQGPGIPEAERERVFERFYRSQATGYGSGLGLSIAQRIAELHGARIDLSEGDGERGLSVRVIFPRPLGAAESRVAAPT